MQPIVETEKPFARAVAGLDSSVKNHNFGVLHIHDLATILRNNSIDFSEERKILEVCNPQQAGKMLSRDMRLNTALPCRISVHTKQGKTKIGLIKPAPMLSALSDDAEWAPSGAGNRGKNVTKRCYKW